MKPIVIKKSRRGLLHAKLGVPQGQKIPMAKIERAMHSRSPALRKEANFAKNFGHPDKAKDYFGYVASIHKTLP